MACVPAAVCRISVRAVSYGYQDKASQSFVPAVRGCVCYSRRVLRTEYPSCISRSRRCGRDHFSSDQQIYRRVFRIRGQYTDIDHRRLSRILEYIDSADRSVFNGVDVLSVYADKKEIQQEIGFSICTVPVCRLYRRDDIWDILKKTKKSRWGSGGAR